MILIRVNSSNNKIESYHESPEFLNEDERNNGIMVDEFPVVEQKHGKSGSLMYNEETNSVYVEYEDRPLTQEEINQEMLDTLNYMILQNEGLV